MGGFALYGLHILVGPDMLVAFSEQSRDLSLKHARCGFLWRHYTDTDTRASAATMLLLVPGHTKRLLRYAVTVNAAVYQ